MNVETKNYYLKDYPHNLISTVFPPYREYSEKAVIEAMEAVNELPKFDRYLLINHYEYHVSLREMFPNMKVQMPKDLHSKAVCRFAYKIMENRYKNGISHICTLDDILHLDVNFLLPNTYVRYRPPKRLIKEKIYTVGDVCNMTESEFYEKGEKRLETIKTALKNIGLSFKSNKERENKMNDNLGREVGIIRETTNYDMFKLIINDGQREINSNHVKEIAKDMAENGWSGPEITVNEKMEICEGDHRFFAAKLTNTPVRYTIEYGITGKDCQKRNRLQQNWKTKDYIHYYATRENNECYKWLSEMVRKYNTEKKTKDKLMVQTIYMICQRQNTSNGSSNTIQVGKFHVNKAEMKEAEKELEYISKYVHIGSAIKGRLVYFYTALVHAYRDKNTDNGVLYNVIERTFKRGELEPQGSTYLYLRLFSKLYNFHRSQENRIYLHQSWEQLTGIRNAA